VGIGPCLVVWRGTCPDWLSPANGDPGSTQILTQHCGAQSQSISQLESSAITPTSKSPQLSSSGSPKHLRIGSVHTLHHILTTWMEPRGFIKPSAHNQAVHMELSLCLNFLPQTQPQGLHGGHRRGIPSQDRGGFCPTSHRRIPRSARSNI
jgi:hypothetical protein